MVTSPTLSVADVIAELVAATRPHCTTPLVQRLERAAVIAQMPYAIHAGPTADSTYVHCLQDWGTTYVVTAAGCTCPDFLNRGGLCKHMLAIELLSRATAERNRRQRALDFGEIRYTLTAQGEAALAARA
jgi:SWIM zinc finger